jgi:hypothetical protein
VHPIAFLAAPDRAFPSLDHLTQIGVHARVEGAEAEGAVLTLEMAMIPFTGRIGADVSGGKFLRDLFHEISQFRPPETAAS